MQAVQDAAHLVSLCVNSSIPSSAALPAGSKVTREVAPQAAPFPGKHAGGGGRSRSEQTRRPFSEISPRKRQQHHPHQHQPQHQQHIGSADPSAWCDRQLKRGAISPAPARSPTRAWRQEQTDAGSLKRLPRQPQQQVGLGGTSALSSNPRTGLPGAPMPAPSRGNLRRQWR